MKKYLLTLCATALALTAGAGTSPGLEYAWGKIIDGPTTSGDQSIGIDTDKDGNVYWFGTCGSTEAEPDITFGGEYLYSGTPYSAGNSQNNNFTLIKTDADGNLLWNVHSAFGDFDNNAGGCAASSDGGIIIVSKVRHTDGMTEKKVTLVDAGGESNTLDWTCADPSRRNYILLVTKITADGAVSWMRPIKFSTEPGPSAAGNYASYWANVFNCSGMTVDDKDNIYIALNFRNPVYIGKADGSEELITPVNNTSWSGDPQAAVGDFLLLGLDADGYYRNSLTLQGEAAAAYCQKAVFADGKIYAQGYICGNGSALKAGQHSIVPSDVISPLILCTDTAMDVKWAKCFKGEKVQNKNALQNTGLSVADGNLWVCGMFNLKFSDPDDPTKYIASTQGSLREGYILKLDAATGEWLAARGSRDDDWNEPSAVAKTGLTGYTKVLQNNENPDKIYVFGYVMNGNVGVFLRQYNALTLEANLDEGQNNLVTEGGAPSSQCIAYDASNAAAYFTARGNQAFKTADGKTTPAPVRWGILASKCTLPSDMKTTGLEDICTDLDTPAEYYNLQGIRVDRPGHGIYIRRRGSSMEKVRL